MSSTQGPDDGPEQSMEDILASIRRIIADDGAARKAEAGAAQPGDAATDDDVLVLTDMVSEDGSVVSLTEPDPAPELQVEELAAPEPTWPEPMREEPMNRDDAQIAGLSELQRQSLLSDRTAAVSSAALSQLSSAFPRPADTTGGKTIEEVVKEAITPMLREWLDANLAIIVERLVRREIERLVRRAEENV